jgi:uncharacterized short protein YbdD (DUF466 family)
MNTVRAPMHLGAARIWRRLVQTARLCCGVPDYEAYVVHLRQNHPERPVPDYATFFRQRQDARYRRGGCRCC